MEAIHYRLPSAYVEEIARLEERTEAFLKGNLSAGELKSQRVPFGIYEQRKGGTFMVRVRCPAGIVTPRQLLRVSRLAAAHGGGTVHLTTRQEIQIHDLALPAAVRVIGELAVAGLSTRGGGGNTVRNITASPDAGISRAEAFDVAPYAVELTSRLIEEEDSWRLPRKLKISFSGGDADDCWAGVADLGFLARLREGERGFKVFIGGGLGARPAPARGLYDFLADGEVYNVVRAARSLFARHGDRRNRHRARLRFLYQQLGEARFRAAFQEELQRVRAQGVPPLALREIENRPAGRPRRSGAAASFGGGSSGRDYERWRSRYVCPQKQEGLFAVLLPAPLGLLEAQQVERLASFLKPRGDNVVRITREQNLLLRNFLAEDLPALYRFLQGCLEVDRPPLLARMISCAGAATCQLGICNSRAAMEAIVARLQGCGAELDAVQEPAPIYMSGCPNSCGLHHLAALGLYGKAGRSGDRLYPAYVVVLGACTGAAGTVLAQRAGEVAARDVPAFVEEVIRDYLSVGAGYRSFADYTRVAAGRVRRILERYARFPAFRQDLAYYVDWGTEAPFSLQERGTGECSAGLLDLIELDVKAVEAALEELRSRPERAGHRAELLRALVFHASRMLIPARGEEARDGQEVFDAFIRHFIETGLVSRRFLDIVVPARRGILPELEELEKEVQELAERVLLLYRIMDDHLQFPEQEPQDGEAGGPFEGAAEVRGREGTPAADVFMDLRGVACPINFVKVKLRLATMARGESLEAWLDDGEPVRNVPRSAAEEGHAVLRTSRVGQHWSVVIRKEREE